MRRFELLTALALVAGLAAAAPGTAEACGGFFCSRTPVDQNAERIVFEVKDGRVRAIVQITYSGRPEDFAWVLPAPGVPVVEDTFPERALQALDVATGPQFTGFWCWLAEADGGGPPNAGGPGGGVTVHERKVVGPFDTVTVSSEDPEALVTWLNDEGFRITAAMVPYVRMYVEEGMVFIAMKLVPDADTGDIAPIVFSWEGEEPVIPLRLTAVAAEPEMGVTTWVLGDERFRSANFANLRVEAEDLAIDPQWAWDGSGNPTNYLQHVARLVDTNGGRAFVTEMAGSTGPLKEAFENGMVPPDDEEAVAANDALIELLGRSPYVTRLYTRLSPEEMQADPQFEPDPDGGDVSREIDLSVHMGEDGCDMPPPGAEGDGAADPCAFMACGAGGECFLDEEGTAACACVDGAVARAVRENGRNAVTCQDARLRFPNDGEITFEPACAAFDCGEHGACVDVNGTPTCRCERGYVATGRLEEVMEGEVMAVLRETRCVVPKDGVPDDFYARELPDLGPLSPGVGEEGEGEGVAEGEGEGVAEGEGEGVAEGEGEGVAEGEGEGGGGGGGGGGGASTPTRESDDSGWCAVAPGTSARGGLPLLALGLGLLWFRRRLRR